MRQTFGQMPTSLPAGFFKAVRFPALAKLDTQTGDHRYLTGEGGGVRHMPEQIRFQPAVSYGHEGAVPSGTLFEVVLDTDTGEFSGRGFLLNDENGRRHARMIATQAQDRNSVDLADVSARYEEDMDTGDWRINFTKWNLAATTGVGTPAFAEAYAEVDPLSDEELMASIIGDDPMEELVASCEIWDVRDIAGAPEPEIVADGAIKFDFADFYMPEMSPPQKIVVTEDGRVYGHLAEWNSCHDGIEGQCVMPPRPRDGYGSFNQAGPLTERGQVQTGPIFFLGGHPEGGLKGKTISEAYGGVENAWADVRVIEGVHGPWLSGRVRPGMSQEALHVARCSRISGHWVGDRLVGVVSVNVPGFNVAGATEGELDLVAGFAFHVNDDGVSELVASFKPCDEITDGTRQLAIEFPDGLTSEQAMAIGNFIRVTLEGSATGSGEDTDLTVATITTDDAFDDADADDDLIIAALLDE